MRTRAGYDHRPGDSTELDAAPPSATRRGLRVLLAEDDAATVETAAKVLRGRGYVVRTATSLSRALEAASDEFDVVVSDLDLDGEGIPGACHNRGRHSNLLDLGRLILHRMPSNRHHSEVTPNLADAP